MKHLSFRVIALCILVPPFLYTFTLSALEAYLQKRYRRACLFHQYGYHWLCLKKICATPH